MMDFEGKVAIVTGGTKGIGKGVALRLAEGGANLVIVGRDAAALGQTAGEIASAHGVEVVAVAGDVGQPETARRAMEAARDRFGQLDILANIAGVFPTARLIDTSDEFYAETIAANLTGTFLMCRAALPMLRAQRGCIVNMSSTAARLPTPGLSVYGATKAGIESLSRALAAEEAPAVRVNVVSAGPTRTETVDALMKVDETGAVDTVTRAIPLQRLGETGEIAEAVAFLASDRASFITGQVLHANGGGIMA